MKILYVEGADCIGKTTFIKKLKSKLKENSYRVFTTREPDYFVRSELLQNKDKQYDYYVQRLMMGASHIQKLQDIKELKMSGEYDVVVVDRTSIISDYVYGCRLNADKNFNLVNRALSPIIEEVNSELINDSFLLLGYLNEDEFEKRVSKRGDGVDVLDTYEIKHRVRELYDDLISDISRNGEMSEYLTSYHFKDIFIANLEKEDDLIDYLIRTNLFK